MARKAAAESDEVQEIQKPDFARALKIMLNDVRPAEEKNASSRGDLSAAWKAIEDDCHVNKKAAKQFAKLRAMSPEMRDDYLRSLYGLMKIANIGISRDLVDAMESKDDEALEMPIVEPGAREGLATLESAEVH